jgi:hypothetical protein
MERIDTERLRNEAVYPGHAITLAYLIVNLYPSLEAASAPGRHFTAVEEDGRLPGAGGHQNQAVELLRQLALGRDWDTVAGRADESWARCDGQKNGGYGEFAQKNPDYYADRWRRGQEQADRIRPLLRAALQKWDLVVVERVDLGVQVPAMPVDSTDPYGRLKFGYGTERVEQARQQLGDRATPETVGAYLAKRS